MDAPAMTAGLECFADVEVDGPTVLADRVIQAGVHAIGLRRLDPEANAGGGLPLQLLRPGADNGAGANTDAGGNAQGGDGLRLRRRRGRQGRRRDDLRRWRRRRFSQDPRTHPLYFSFDEGLDVGVYTGAGMAERRVFRAR